MAGQTLGRRNAAPVQGTRARPVPPDLLLRRASGESCTTRPPGRQPCAVDFGASGRWPPAALARRRGRPPPSRPAGSSGAKISAKTTKYTLAPGRGGMTISVLLHVSPFVVAACGL